MECADAQASSDSRESGGSSSILDMLALKKNNFCARFGVHLIHAKMYDKLNLVPIPDVIAAFIIMAPYHALIEEEDADSLIAIFELSDFADKDAMLRVYREDLLPEERSLLWRYIKFFLHAVQELK
jgi:hypothetical protein